MTKSRDRSRIARAPHPFIVVLGSALALVSIARLASATTITVNTTGAPVSGKCNLTDAVQAAVTNVAVHGCPAGSGSNSDTIQLAATTYQGYGKTLHIPSSGGALVIQGPSGTFQSAIIVASDYGYPVPNPINSNVCPYPAAVFSGGTLTLKDLTLQANQDGTTGVCQYAGSVTISHAIIGDAICPPHFGFNRGGVWSYPNTTKLHRTLTVTAGSLITGNYTFQHGGGIAAFGNVDVTVNASGGQPSLSCNTCEGSGGGLAWVGDGSGKMGNLTLSGVNVTYNDSFSWGAGLYLDGDDPAATATIGATIEQNHASFTGGGIFVGTSLGLNKVILSSTFIGAGNDAAEDAQQLSLNSDPNTYNAISCKAGSSVETLHGSEWSGHNPPLKGDGTCFFP